MNPPASIEGQPDASGRQINVPAGTKVRIQRLPTTQPVPQPTFPASQADCPAGTTFDPGSGPPPTCPPEANCAPFNYDAPSCRSSGGTVVPPASSATVPWYRRGSTYAVAGGVLLLVVIVVAIARKG